ncbi:MAG: RHS repeat-associated core domain-containing protein, partial [Planctomyces sp.]
TGLYHYRARWYDPISGTFLSEDPLGFDAGDANVTRYTANNPVNITDPSGMSWLSRGLRGVTDTISDAVRDVRDFVKEIGYFVEEHWDNGNIGKVLLGATTVVSAGLFAPAAVTGFSALAATGTLAGSGISAAGLSLSSVVLASAGVNAWQGFSGEQLGDGTLGRILSSTATVGSGLNTVFSRTSALMSARAYSMSDRVLDAVTLSNAAVAGYEIGTGDILGDGTLSGYLNVTSLGLNSGPVLRDRHHGWMIRTDAGLRIAAGSAGLVNTSDSGLQQSLKTLSMISGVSTTSVSVAQAGSTITVAQRRLKELNRPARTSSEAAVSAPRGPAGSPPSSDDEIPFLSMEGYEATDGWQKARHSGSNPSSPERISAASELWSHTAPTAINRKRDPFVDSFFQNEIPGFIESFQTQDLSVLSQPIVTDSDLTTPIFAMSDVSAVLRSNDNAHADDVQRYLQQKPEYDLRKLQQFERDVYAAAQRVDARRTIKADLAERYRTDDSLADDFATASQLLSEAREQYIQLTGQQYNGTPVGYLAERRSEYARTLREGPTFADKWSQFSNSYSPLDYWLGEKSATDPQHQYFLYRHYLTNPSEMDADLAIGFYTTSTVAVASGTLATGGMMFGAGSIGTIATYGGGLVTAGGIAGGIDGGLGTYAAGMNSYGEMSFGVGTGIAGGVLNPIQAFTSLGGGVVGGAVDSYYGGNFLGSGYQVGSFAGGIVGMGADDIYKGARWLHASGQTVINGGIMGGTALGTYQYTGNVDAALFAGNIASVPGTMFARWSIPCFPAGTPVLTPHGPVPIEDLRAGDVVLSRDEHNVEADIGLQVIEETFRRTGAIRRIRIGDGDFLMTPEHPLYVNGKGWTPAAHVEPGDLLAVIQAPTISATKRRQVMTAGHSFERTLLSEFQGELLDEEVAAGHWRGDWQEVRSNQPTGDFTTVYNFRVANWHTYFIGHPSLSLWVHNSCDLEVAESTLTRGE